MLTSSIKLLQSHNSVISVPPCTKFWAENLINAKFMPRKRIQNGRRCYLEFTEQKGLGSPELAFCRMEAHHMSNQ